VSREVESLSRPRRCFRYGNRLRLSAGKTTRRFADALEQLGRIRTQDRRSGSEIRLGSERRVADMSLNVVGVLEQPRRLPPP
jgi:hypothetical protein